MTGHPHHWTSHCPGKSGHLGFQPSKMLLCLPQLRMSHAARYGLMSSLASISGKQEYRALCVYGIGLFAPFSTILAGEWHSRTCSLHSPRLKLPSHDGFTLLSQNWGEGVLEVFSVGDPIAMEC